MPTSFLETFFDDFLKDAPFAELEFPAVDVHETGIEIVVKAELPGMEKDDFSISVENGLLTIQGEKKCEEKVEEKAYHRTERRYGSFRRVLRLPAEIDVDKAAATYRNGVLELRLPRAEAAVPKQIAINS
jgi:HSP20 family protein